MNTNLLHTYDISLKNNHSIIIGIFIFSLIYVSIFYFIYSDPNYIRAKEIKHPRRERRGIEDFFLKSLCIRGNKSPVPPVLRPKGRGIKPKAIKK